MASVIVVHDHVLRYLHGIDDYNYRDKRKIGYHKSDIRNSSSVWLVVRGMGLEPTRDCSR